MEWIKVKTRELTLEERELYPYTDFMWDMKVPEDGDEVLLSDGKTIWDEVWIGFGYGAIGFEYTEPDDYKNLWYMPFPELPEIDEG